LHNKVSLLGIDLWHAVEFSRYGCALQSGISSIFQGRPPNLVHGYAHGQTGLYWPRSGSCAVRPCESPFHSKGRNYRGWGGWGQIAGYSPTGNL